MQHQNASGVVVRTATASKHCCAYVTTAPKAAVSHDTKGTAGKRKRKLQDADATSGNSDLDACAVIMNEKAKWLFHCLLQSNLTGHWKAVSPATLLDQRLAS